MSECDCYFLASEPTACFVAKLDPEARVRIELQPPSWFQVLEPWHFQVKEDDDHDPGAVVVHSLRVGINEQLFIQGGGVSGWAFTGKPYSSPRPQTFDIAQPGWVLAVEVENITAHAQRFEARWYCRRLALTPAAPAVKAGAPPEHGESRSDSPTRCPTCGGSGLHPDEIPF